MMRHRILTLLASTAPLVVLAAGCTVQSPGAGGSSLLPEPAASPSAVASQLSGTWHGAFWQAGGHGTGGSAVEGEATLEIKDDATYTLTWTRRGSQTSTIRDSGIVVASGRGVTLKSARGNSLPLMRNCDTLHGLTTHATGYTVKVTVERVR
jgi:hypothetical protein